MLNSVPSVVVLLTTHYHNRLLVVGLKGGHAEDVVMADGGVLIVEAGAAVTGLHCVETGENLTLDEDYAVFHTGKPEDFVQQFVPALRQAVSQLGWPKVRDSLKAYLAGRSTETDSEDATGA